MTPTRRKRVRRVPPPDIDSLPPPAPPSPSEDPLWLPPPPAREKEDASRHPEAISMALLLGSAHLTPAVQYSAETQPVGELETNDREWGGDYAAHQPASLCREEKVDPNTSTGVERHFSSKSSRPQEAANPVIDSSLRRHENGVTYSYNSSTSLDPESCSFHDADNIEGKEEDKGPTPDCVVESTPNQGYQVQAAVPRPSSRQPTTGRTVGISKAAGEQLRGGSDTYFLGKEEELMHVASPLVQIRSHDPMTAARAAATLQLVRKDSMFPLHSS
jgi:hypothetical protein